MQESIAIMLKKKKISNLFLTLVTVFQGHSFFFIENGEICNFQAVPYVRKLQSL